jgi:hypothetical protein
MKVGANASGIIIHGLLFLKIKTNYKIIKLTLYNMVFSTKFVM